MKPFYSRNSSAGPAREVSKSIGTLPLSGSPKESSSHGPLDIKSSGLDVKLMQLKRKLFV